ncbi:MAG: sensor domain-containing diguanylate cyclase [Leptospiraceae bacterium]|nr:sensor domain-containing diguanylate cyclase [Leptospiraceae bacterium]
MELERLNELKKYELDKLPEDELNLLVQIAAELCGAEYAYISIVDEFTVWTKAAAFNRPMEINKREDDICHYTIMKPEPLVINDIGSNEEFKHLPVFQNDSSFKSYLGANLTTPNGHRIGTLCILSKKVKNFTSHQIQLLNGLAHQIVNNFELKKKNKQLEENNKILDKIANVDTLTGLMSRRAFFHAIENAKNEESKNSLFLLYFLDIDNFKKINDTYGHDMGDLVLEKIGEVLLKYENRSTFVARFGGEELCIFKISDQEFDYLGFGDSIRKEISEIIISLNATYFQTTVSIGVSKSQNEPDLKISELIKKSDIALYKAKTSGKNKIVENET